MLGERNIGLSSEEVKVRIEKGLVNKSIDKKVRSNWSIFSDYFFTLFNLFNFLIAIALIIVGAYSNLFYMAIIIINICIGVVQEINAKRLVEKLSIINSSRVNVVRDGVVTRISIEEVVIDDIMVLSSGNQIVADSIVVEGNIEVNESLLTGESDNVLKNNGSKLLSGSYVVSGKCHAKVEHVGKDNFASQVMSKVKKHKKTNSELLNSMSKVTKFTSFFILPIGILLFCQAYFIGEELLKYSVISTAGALLGMLPKGLLLLISITLATGVIKLAKKEVLVQELYSIETLARVDILCLDKTGTITEGKMCVTEVYELSNEMPLTIKEALIEFVNNSEDNNSTSIALKEKFVGKSSHKCLSRISFSSERKYSSITFDFGTLIIGAIEKINSNEYQLPQQVIDAQSAGKRIIVLGYSKEAIKDNIMPLFNIVAAIEIDDPLRQNAAEMLGYFKSEGINVKIISGDNPLTVSYIAKKAGLENYNSYIDLSNVNSDEEVIKSANNYDIFARVSPNQKSLIIKSLQEDGHTVAMTGDGVNDIIALHQADCGIAMLSGSDAAKKASQIILMNSDFGVLKDILMEGRRVVNNVTNVAKIFFIKTIYSLLLSLICIITFTSFPFMPIQITLIDLAIEAYTSLFISFEPNSEKVQGSFLKTVIKNSLAYALTIIINIIIITIIVRVNELPIEIETSLKYYMIGFVSILAVIKTCIPFNRIRAFLATTTAFGFYIAAYIFRDLLHLEILNEDEMVYIFILASVSLVIIFILKRIIDAIYNMFSDQEDEDEDEEEDLDL